MAISLIARRDFHLYDQLVRYRWCDRYGYMTSTGQSFNTGRVKRQTIEKFELRRKQFAQTHNINLHSMDTQSDPRLLEQFDIVTSQDNDLENGALMRLASVPLFFFRDPSSAVKYSGLSARTTHDNVKAYDACRYYAALIVATFKGYSKDRLLDQMFYQNHRDWFGEKPLDSEILCIAKGSFKKKQGYADGIRGSRSIVSSLKAALWAFWAHETFEEGALAAVNLGDDTSGTAAIFGQLAGAFYGLKNLPNDWLEHLYAREFILNISQWIVYEGDYWQQYKRSNIISDGENNTKFENDHRSGLGT